MAQREQIAGRLHRPGQAVREDAVVPAGRVAAVHEDDLRDALQERGQDFRVRRTHQQHPGHGLLPDHLGQFLRELVPVRRVDQQVHPLRAASACAPARTGA